MGIYALTRWAFTHTPKPKVDPFVDKSDVSVLRLAIDPQARQDVQQAIERVADRVDARTQRGDAAVLRAAALALRRARATWIYAGVANFAPEAMPAGESRFRAEVERARNLSGDPQLGGGPELALVTIVIAGREFLVDFHDSTDAEQISAWLEMMSRMPDREILAVQVIWTPADPAECITSLEVERLFRDMRRLRGDAA